MDIEDVVVPTLGKASENMNLFSTFFTLFLHFFLHIFALFAQYNINRKRTDLSRFLILVQLSKRILERLGIQTSSSLVKI
jgi:hypothetical protein